MTWPEDPRAPSAESPTPAKFFYLGDGDSVWCRDCKAWIPSDGDTSDCEHPSLQVEMDDAPPATIEDAQEAIDNLYAELRRIDDHVARVAGASA